MNRNIKLGKTVFGISVYAFKLALSFLRPPKAKSVELGSVLKKRHVNYMC